MISAQCRQLNSAARAQAAPGVLEPRRERADHLLECEAEPFDVVWIDERAGVPDDLLGRGAARAITGTPHAIASSDGKPKPS